MQANPIFDRFLKNGPPLFLLLLPLAMFSSLTWQGVFSFPNADDFCFAREAKSLGPVGAAMSYYGHWTGRISSSLLIAAFGGTPGWLPQFYWVSAIAVLIGFFVGVAYALRVLGISSWKFAAVASSLLLAGISWRESVLWLSGAATYAFGSVLCIFLWSQYWRLAFMPARSSKRWIAVLATLTFIAGAFNEPLSIAQSVLLAGLLVIVWRRTGRVSLALALISAAAVAAILVVVLAPGNSVREVNFERLNMVVAAYKSIGWTIGEHSHWILSAYVVLSCTAILLRVRITVLSRSELLSVAALLFLAAWAAVFVRFYAVGASGPVRAWTVEIALLFFVVLFVSQASFLAISDSLDIALSKSRALNWLMASAAVVALLQMPTPDNETLRSSIAAAKYSKRVYAAASERFARLAHAKPTDHVELDDLPFKSKALSSFWDIGTNPNEGQNRCMAAYFNVASVKLMAGSQAQSPSLK